MRLRQQTRLPRWLLLALCLLPACGQAQTMLGQSVPGATLPANGNANATAVAPPPPIIATPLSPQAAPLAPASSPPPGLVPTPVPPANSDSNADSNTDSPANPPPASTATTPPAISTPLTPPQDWVPGKTVQIGVLDKVDGAIGNLTIPVGGQTTAGDLQISVQACVAHPANELPDAAIFITVQASGAPGAAPLYRGWMVRSIPAEAVVGDASETLRVVDCS